MDIKYIRDNEIHEKYILNQLDEKEKHEYEAFLQSSPEARQELEQTKKLIAGIRAIGASNMRKEIEEQVADLRNPKTDWSIMYKAAAVLFIFVLLPAIFYYQHEFADQDKITEQMMTETYSEPAKKETIEKAAASESVVEEEMDEIVSEDIRIQQPEEKEERAVIVKNETVTKVSEAPKARRGRTTSNEDVIVVETDKITPLKDKGMQSAVGGGNVIEIADAVSSEALESDMIEVEPPAKLDEVLSRAASSGVAKSSKSDLPSTAKVAAPSRSIGNNYIPGVRSFTFINNSDSLILKLNRINLREPFPDVLKINVIVNSLNQQTLDIFVSDQLHSFGRDDIDIEWDKENLINIIFSDKAIYKIKLEENEKTAKKVE